MPDIIRLSLDTEFNEQNLPPVKAFGVDFISIGLTNIDRDHENFYAVSRQFNEKAARSNVFVNEAVLPKLEGEKRLFVRDIAENLRSYIQRQKEITPEAEKIEFWSKNGTYDEFILCRLFGGMNKLYEFANGIEVKKTKFRDLDELKYPSFSQNPKPEGDEDKLHHALYDAQIQAEIIRWVENEARLDIERQHQIAADSARMFRLPNIKPRRSSTRSGGPRRR